MNEVAQEEKLDLVQWIGRKQAFSLIAAKTTAAEVECLRRIRDGEMFRAVALDWSEFCQKYVGVSSSYANRLIRQLEEFGPNYFDLSRIMRISPESYRQIAGSVSDGSIALGGERIAITPENTGKIAEAVKTLREQQPVADPKEKPPKLGVAALRKRLQVCIADMNQVLQRGLDDSQRDELADAVSAGMLDLKMLSMAMES